MAALLLRLPQNTIFNSELINAFFYCSILSLSLSIVIVWDLVSCVSIQNLTFKLIKSRLTPKKFVPNHNRAIVLDPLYYAY